MGANPKDLFAAVGQLTAAAMRPFPDPFPYPTRYASQSIEKMASIPRCHGRTTPGPTGASVKRCI